MTGFKNKEGVRVLHEKVRNCTEKHFIIAEYKDIKRAWEKNLGKGSFGEYKIIFDYT